ncbi:TPA: DUF4116 domain-containing protein [Clostridioides difficile]
MAVKQNGLAIQFVQKQTDEICVEAIKQNKKAIKYIKNKERRERILRICNANEGIITYRQVYIDFLKEFK